MDWVDPDGIIGLAPRPRNFQKGENKKHWLVWELYESKQIEKPMFSLYFTDYHNKFPSKITLGGYD